MLVDDGVLVARTRTADGSRRDARTRSASRRRSARCSPRGSTGSAATERAVAQRASVVGRVFERSAVAELTPGRRAATASRPALLALVRKELIRPERTDDRAVETPTGSATC